MPITKHTINAAKPHTVLKDSIVKGLEIYIGVNTQTWRVYYRTKSERKERRLKIGYYPTISLSQARDIAKEKLLEVAKGNDPARREEDNAPTLGELWEEFIDFCARKRKPKTIQSYEGLYSGYLRTLEGRRITDIRTSELVKLHRAAPPYAANRAMALLGRLYTYAASCDYVRGGFNPARGVERNPELARRRYADERELRAVGDGIRRWSRRASYRERQLADILALLILTGARKTEITGSKNEWYDLERGKLSLPDSKTGAKDIHLPLPAIDIVRRNISSSREFLFQQSALVQPYEVSSKMWKAFKEDCGVGSDLRIHDLRRSYATYARSAGIGLGDIGKLLGHASSQTTERSYAFLKDDVKADKGNQVSDVLMRRLGNT